MRTKVFAFLLISTLVANAITVFAQEAPVETSVTDVPDVIEVVPEEAVITEPVSIPVEPVPAETTLPVSIEEPSVEQASTSSEVTEEAGAQVLDITAPLLPEMTEEATSTPEPFISLVIRHGEQVAWSGTTTLPSGGTVLVTPTGGTEEIEIASDSLLGVLVALDQTSDDFSISDLDYYPSFGSFIVNCISAPAFSEACAQWQYVIDGQYPFTGIDKYRLESGDEVFLYFGSPRRVLIGETTVRPNEPFAATAQSYDPSTNAYDPLPGYTIGITQPNPADPWTPLEVATSTSSSDGTATFTLSAKGAYGIGLKEDFYFPATPFTVSSTTDTGSDGTVNPVSSFDIAAAYAFLRTGQGTDGAWQSDLVTDWSAIALATSGAPSDMKSSLAGYLRNEDVDLDTVRDYERHAMALMALNINPYTGGPEDYITPIAESFDGTQIDDPSIVNDDAFALIVLLNAGYTKNDEIIQKIASFIVSEQRDDGSWEGGVDVSGPYMQALSKVATLPGVGTALVRAESYLRSAQEADGGFGDPFATAWAIQGIRAIGGSPDSWTKGDHTPLTYLHAAQEEDGGLKTTPDDYSTRAWATAYAIPAVKGLTWDSMLRNFRKSAATDTDESPKETETTTMEATTTEEVLSLALPLPAETDAASSTISAAPLSVAAAQEVIATPVKDAVAAEPEPEEHPLTATALESGAWPWLKRLLSSFWSAVVGLFV